MKSKFSRILPESVCMKQTGFLPELRPSKRQTQQAAYDNVNDCLFFADGLPDKG